MKAHTVIGKAALWLLLPCFVGAFSVDVLAAVPDAPRNLTVSMAHESWEPDHRETDPNVAYRTTLEWQVDDDADVSVFRVYFKEVIEWGSGEGVFTVLAETESTSLVVNDYLAIEQIGSKAYSFRVTAVNRAGESEPSNPVSTACGRTWNGGDIGTYNGGGGDDGGPSRILTQPPFRGIIGTEYRYDAQVVADYSRHDASEVVFALLRGPEGMRVDPATGVVTWTPRETGRVFIAVSASYRGIQDSDVQSWAIDVEEASVTGVRESYGMDAGARLYPNPATAAMQVRFTAEGGPATLSVRNLHGAVVHTLQVQSSPGSNALTLDTDALAPGSYFLQIRTTRALKTLPFSIVR